jgi:ABC-2 type transport system permease protein
MTAFLTLLHTELKLFIRDRMASFFTFLFPLIFILLFGFLIGGTGDIDTAHMGVVFASEQDAEILEAVIAKAGSMEIERFDTPAHLQEEIEKRKVDFGLAWDGESLRFYYNPARVQENYAFEQVARGIVTDFDLRHQGLSPILSVEEVHVGPIAATNWFNLVVPGILAFSVLSAGLSAVAGHLTSMKERKTLDRMIVTPMSPLALLGAIIVIRLVVVYVSTLITLFVGILLFNLNFQVNWLQYTIFVLCATVGTMGLGTAIALIVRRPSSASNVANVFSMVMLFTAGVYFPIEFMPAYLRAASKALPLTHMAEAMRFVTGVSEMSLPRFWGITLGLLATAVILFPLLARYVVRAQRH